MIHPLDVALEHARAGRLDESYNILLTMPDDPRAQFNLGFHEMRRGNFKKGMEGLAVGRFGGVFGSPPLATDRPIWRDEPLRDRKVLLHGEGGYGDEIANVRFAKDFKDMGAYVTVSCSRSLMPLFRTLSYVDALVTREQAHGADFDYWVPAMSAALVLDYEYEDMSGKAYIPRPEPVHKSMIRNDLKSYDGKKIGLKWSGNPAFEDEQLRLFPKELMLGLVTPAAQFYSLQKEFDDSGLPQLAMGDWLETARSIAALDLVITSCTSIAHIAGAMGVPVWVVVPICPYYIWALPENTSPWYNSARIYRQTVQGSWQEPFTSIREHLKDFVSEDRNATLLPHPRRPSHGRPADTARRFVAG